MTNKKGTKRALLSSMVALLICFSMLVGTTLAWFTDSVTSEGNIIQSGTLEVGMYWANGTEAVPAVGSADWTNASQGAIFDYDNWEPGYTEVRHILIANEGTLALKYQLLVSATGEVSKLADVIDVYFVDPAVQVADRTALTDANKIGTLTEVLAGMPASTFATLISGDSDVVTIALKMQEDAGNEYQELSIGSKFAIKLIATQLTAETDSFDDQYDADAWFDIQKDASGAYLLYSAEDLKAFNAEMNKPGVNGEGNRFTVKLMSDIDMKGADWLSVNEMFFTFDGQGHTISNINCVENGNKSGFFGYLGGGKIMNLTLENVTSVGSQAGIFLGQAEGCDIINCNIAGTNYVAWDDDSVDATTKNGIGAYVGVSVESNETSGKILAGTTITLNTNGMETAASGVWTVNDKYVGGLYTENQTVNVIDESNGVASLTKVSDGLYKDASNNQYVDSAAGLAALNTILVNKSTTMKGISINILSDIDFTGYTWTPVDSHADTAFYLSAINGNGNTISNLTINGQAMFKRFAGSGDVLVQDITFEKATVNSTAINSSILTVQTYQNTVLDNVDVIGATITGGYKVAPLIATVYNESSSSITLTLKNCDVADTTVTATSYDFCTAGLVAFVYADDNDKIEFENCTVTNVTLSAPDDVYDAHAWVYTTDSESLYNEAEGVTVTNCTFVPYNG